MSSRSSSQHPASHQVRSPVIVAQQLAKRFQQQASMAAAIQAAEAALPAACLSLQPTYGLLGISSRRVVDLCQQQQQRRMRLVQ